MQSSGVHSRMINGPDEFPFEFTIGTLVTDHDEYAEMIQSFVSGGFDSSRCEYLHIDNSGDNAFGAYAGLNRLLRAAKGRYVILCHQDILLAEDGFDHLAARIADINEADPDWAVLGNAGSINIKFRAVHLIQSSTAKDNHEPVLPLRAQTLDENFLVVRRSANLALSADLEGFHFYGADICLIADVLGFRCYVIDFKLIHKSLGNPDVRFQQLRQQLIRKYRRAFRPRFMGTTVTRFYLSGSSWGSRLGNLPPVLFLARQFYKIFRKKFYKLKLKDS